MNPPRKNSNVSWFEVWRFSAQQALKRKYTVYTAWNEQKKHLENRPKPKRKGWYSNHPVSGCYILVSGNVIIPNSFRIWALTIIKKLSPKQNKELHQKKNATSFLVCLCTGTMCAWGWGILAATVTLRNDDLAKSFSAEADRSLTYQKVPQWSPRVWWWVVSKRLMSWKKKSKYL